MPSLGRQAIVLVAVIGFFSHVVAAGPKQNATGLPENLARGAKVSASSEYSRRYLARFAIDGKLPDPGGSADLDQEAQGALEAQGLNQT